MKPKGIQSKGGSVNYGQGYTDKKTQSQMMKFLKASSKFTGSSRLGKSKPNTQLNRDSKPSTDFFDNPLLQNKKKGSNRDERVSEKPLSIKKRNEKQNNKMGPKITKKTTPRKNSAGYSTKYK
jgi:hypothetical protein